MSNKKSLEDRKKFEEDLEKLLDISHPDLEKRINQDRTLGNLEGRKSEDLDFLQDQRGERKMTMGKVDEEFSKKKAAQLKRKFSQVDKELADEALATLSHHLWFLASTSVLFSLVTSESWELFNIL